MPVAERVSTGIAGLDEVLQGGLYRGRTYLVSGPPGTGKTTLGWHFLDDGLQRGERCLFITFGEPESELRANAALSGFTADGVRFLDLSPSSELFASGGSYDIFSAAEVERQPVTDQIVAAMQEHEPHRVFVDSMTHLRYLANDALQFRRQALSFLRFLVDGGSAVMLTSESSPELPDDDLRFLCDGVIEVALGARTRLLTVTKLRGSGFRGGRHAMRLGARGALVFPRLIPESHHRPYVDDVLPSGIDGLDALLHGGIERGTVSLISGPSGVGKTTLGAQFMKEAAARGERSTIYTFDERADTLVRRCEGIGIPMRGMAEQGTLAIEEIEALQFSPDEFANAVRHDVEAAGTKIVMIDSVSGYRLSVSGEDLAERLHALCKYLQNVGVTVILINELQGITDFRISDIGISYLADNVIFLRYVEARVDDRAELHRGVGVLKKRLSDFEKTLCDMRITSAGVQVGEPMPHLSGILGVPRDGNRTSRG